MEKFTTGSLESISKGYEEQKVKQQLAIQNLQTELNKKQNLSLSADEQVQRLL